jgi:aminoglycoside N3'-acetyltransferase
MEIIERISRMASNFSVIIIYTSAYPIARALSMDLTLVAETFTKKIMDNLSDQVVLMPTFTKGYNSANFISLDSEKSTSGIISEKFRLATNVRTISAFFSFAASGPNVDRLLDLRPVEAWGSGSLYEWIYNENALIVTVGLHPTHCSFTHYAEQLVEKKIAYRRKKSFSGNVEYAGKVFNLDETLLVRNTDPPALNDFTWLAEHYRHFGQVVDVVDGVIVSGISAHKKIEVLMSFLDKNPNALISNEREIFSGNE